MNHFYSLVIILLTLVTGCATTKSLSVQHYTLELSQTGVKALVKRNSEKSLTIDTPKSIAAIKSRKILYQDKDHTLNAYAFSEWSDTPNRMFASLLLSALIDSTIFKVVLPVDSRADSDYVLESTLHTFRQQINSQTSANALVKITFYLLKKDTTTVISSRVFVSKIDAQSVDAIGGVKSFNTAVNEISDELIEWLLSLEL